MQRYRRHYRIIDRRRLQSFCCSTKTDPAQVVEMDSRKTIFITGASQGAGAGLLHMFFQRGHSVVATARNITTSASFRDVERVAW